jgi:putative isomerase
MGKNDGWNTWDVNHINGLVYRAAGLEIRFSLFDRTTAELKRKFFWKDVIRLGPHHPEGYYSQIAFCWKDAELSLEYAAKEKRAVVRLISNKPTNIILLFDVLNPWNDPISVEEYFINNIVAWNVSTSLGNWLVIPSRAPVIERWNDKNPDWMFTFEEPLIIDLIPLNELPEYDDPKLFIEEQCEFNHKTCLRSGKWLENSADGLTRAIQWNTIWEPTKARICSPVSREWCWNEAWDGYVLFDWDTFFCAMMSVLESPELALANLNAILQEVTPRGFVPNFGSRRSRSDDRSQPPVGAYCALKIAGFIGYESQNITWLIETYSKLVTWHNWWMNARDGNGDGLLEWGSDPITSDNQKFENHSLRAAMWESGLDNSPMYDETQFNLTTHTMELIDVGLNSLYTLDAWALSMIADILGREDDKEKFTNEFNELSERINRILWNESAGIYQNRHWDGCFSSHISPTNFYPLLAGIVSPERAERMIREHLFNEDEFWGKFVLPSIARNDPGYRKVEIIREGVRESYGDYWRGRIWGPMNFLVAEGLRRMGFDQETHLLAEKSLELFNLEWNTESHVHENYNDLTGDGDDVPSSNPLYHWGGLLAFIAFQELVDYEPWTGWRFGNLDEKSAVLDNIHWLGQVIRVETGPEGLMVESNERIILKTNRPALIRNYQRKDNEIIFYIKVASPLDCIVGFLPKAQAIDIIYADSREFITTDEYGCISIPLNQSTSISLKW